VTVGIAVKPMVLWIWVGGAVMAAGTLLALTPARRRPVRAAPGAAGTAGPHPPPGAGGAGGNGDGLSGRNGSRAGEPVGGRAVGGGGGIGE
jgi:hypothetical protein